MWKIGRFSRVVLLSAGSVSLLAGLWLVKLCSIEASFAGWWLWLGFVLVAWVFPRRGIFALIAIIALGFFIGLQRGTAMQLQINKYQQFVGKNVVLYGRIRDDPAYDDKRRLDFRVDSVQIADHSLPGQVRIWTQSSAGVQRGDTIQVQGKMREGFGNYQGAISFAQVTIIKKSTSPIEKVRRQFFVGVYNAVPDPQASLGLGFLVGFKSQLPGELEDQLRMLALTHIVVASGYNLTVLVRLAKRSLAKISKFQAFIGAVGLMCVMLLLTGFSPSMTRAGVVTFLSLSTWYFGRSIHPILLLFLSAALTAWWNPLSTWSDLGWWLSFLAFTGVLVVGPLLTKRLYGDRAPPALVQVAIETLAAQIMVEPLIMLMFGQFSTLGLLANILVVSFVPLAMLATFIAGLAGMLAANVAGWFAVPAEIILGYIIEVVRLLARVPWASQEIPINKLGLTVLYACVALFIAIMMRKTKFYFRELPSVID